ncbi:MAG: tetratricopeptide repeat protein [Alphaproteobacteria bacterium]|nr:tetratricopeptide repeat protein [Alphaproteobacteria bacterium]
MMNWLIDFHFLRPYWLIALFVPLIWWLQIYKSETVQSSWAQVCDEHLLNYLLIKGENKQRRLPYILGVWFLSLMILALSGPSWQKQQNPTLSVDNPVMVVLSLAEDMSQTDIKPSRLLRAKYIIKDVLQTFETTETGLMVYTDEPFVLTPLTEDTSLVENLLPEINENIVPSGGDRLDRAIDMAVGRMQSSGYAKGNLVVFAADIGSYFDAALQSAEKALEQGFVVNVINMTAQENDKLKMIAERGGGMFFNYNQNYDTLSQKINEIYQKELKKSENKQDTWVDFGYNLLWLPALLLLYYFRKGVIFALILCNITFSAQAGWFLNNNQEGMRYFKQQQYKDAAQKFEDVNWRGAAAYKNGDFEQAYHDFATQTGATALYNQGNALAKAGKIDKAIEKYEEVLAQQPDFADAAYNLEYLKQMQQKQNQENKKNKEKQKDDTENEEQQNSQSDGAAQQQNQEQNSADNTNKEQTQSDLDEGQSEQKEQQAQSEEQENAGKKASQNNETEQNNTENKSQSEDTSDDSGQGNSQQEEQSQMTENQTQPVNKNQTNGDNQSAENTMQNSENTDNNSNGAEKQSQSQSSGQNETDMGNDEKMQDFSAQSGKENEQSSTEAQNVQVEFGDNSDEEQQVNARMQKFRNIPEDVGGLLRALIAKEYSKNRYKDE